MGIGLFLDLLNITMFVFRMLIFMSHVLQNSSNRSWGFVGLVQSLLAAPDHLQTAATGLSGFPNWKT